MAAVLAGVVVVAAARAGDAPLGWWDTDGPVRALARGGGLLYAAGEFSYVGPRTGAVALLDPATGAVAGALPDVRGGDVFAVAPDGHGGFFLGGSFTRVGAFERSGLARVRGDGTVDPLFHPRVNTAGTVWALALSGSTLFVGGSFASIAEQERPGLAAVDADSGVAMAWDPDLSGSVYALVLAAGKLYAGGSFSAAADSVRDLAAFDLVTGAAASWLPLNGLVDDLAQVGDTLYVVGSFWPVGGAEPVSAAAFELSTGNRLAWNPEISSQVYAIELAGQTAVLSGGDGTRGVDRVSGDTTWGPVASAGYGLAVANGLVFVGRFKQVVDGLAQPPLVALDAATGAVAGIRVFADGDVRELVPLGDGLVAAGRFRSIGGEARAGMAAFDARTGALSPLQLPVRGQIHALRAIGDRLYMGGNIEVGASRRPYLAEIDLATGQPTERLPVPDAPVTDLAIDGGTLFLAGEFQAVGPSARRFLAAVELTTGVVTGFDPSPDGPVRAIAAGAGAVYAGGDFDAIGGATRTRVAALQPLTGSALPFSVHADVERVTALALDTDTLYIGTNSGLFGWIGDRFLASTLAALDATTGTPQPWDPASGMMIDALEIDDRTLFLAGSSGNFIGERPNRGVAAFSLPLGTLLPFDPDLELFGALAISPSSDGSPLAVGGHLRDAGEHPRTGLAVFSFAGGSDVPTSPPTSGGSGGGSAGPPLPSDVEVTLESTKTAAMANEPVDVRVVVRNRGSGSARELRALITLPPDVRLLGLPAFDRGSGCTGAVTIDCFLDFLPPNTTSVVRFSIDVGPPGTKAILVRLVTRTAELDDANNNSSLTLHVAAPAQTPPAAGTQGRTGVVRTGGNGADVLRGTAADDTLIGRGGRDRLIGLRGDDRLYGGRGNDRLTGGPGRDFLAGGSGADTVYARDGTRDTVRCGSGRDIAIVDRRDLVSRDCETVRRR